MNREPLDRAIDHVAKRLTHVEDDAQFASRIVAALPDRVTWFGWLLHASAPRLAMIGVAAVAIVLWVASPRFAGQSPQITQITTATQPLTNARPLVTSPELVVAAARASVAQQRTTAIASLQPAPGVVVALAFLLWVVPSCLGLGVPSGSAPAWLLNLSQRISDNSAVRWMDLSPLLAVCIALLLSRRRSAS